MRYSFSPPCSQRELRDYPCTPSQEKYRDRLKHYAETINELVIQPAENQSAEDFNIVFGERAGTLGGAYDMQGCILNSVGAAVAPFEFAALRTVSHMGLAGFHKLLKVKVDRLIPQFLTRRAGCRDNHILIAYARDMPKRPV